MTSRDQVLGTYRLTRQITRGNATYIWEAIKLGGIERFVIKVLDEKNRDNKEEVAFLKQEYEVTKQLDHPNVIKVFEMNANCPAFIVLEVFAMLNLKQAIRQERDRLLANFSPIIEQCAAGLNHLHEKGWVHSDIKPDNFLLNEENQIKLIDLSIAKKSATGFFAKMFGGQKIVRGTRSYMSPEQIRGKPMDARADIYSFGCLTFEVLAGKLPYTANSPNELLSKHLSAPVPTVLVHNNDVTPEMNDFLRTMMAKEPEKRPKSMVEVLKTLKTMRIFKTLPKSSAPAEEKAKTKN